MAIARVQISEDKAEFVKALRGIDGETGPFQTYADVVAFAAILGMSCKIRVPLGKFSRKDPDAVLQDQFRNPVIIGLVAVAATQDPKILLDDEDHDLQRVQIFQEFANGGLEILQDKLRGAVDYSEQILLFLKAQRHQHSSGTEEFDLTKFL
ncbi:MAG: DNA phosphorothioation-associated protein 4 [Elainellaceae cyanobacterium]